MSESDSKNYTICNLCGKKVLQHFIGICPVLTEYRLQFFGHKPFFTAPTIIININGQKQNDWEKLVAYLKVTLQ